jgi:hypothetical protein
LSDISDRKGAPHVRPARLFRLARLVNRLRRSHPRRCAEPRVQPIGQYTVGWLFLAPRPRRRGRKRDPRGDRDYAIAARAGAPIAASGANQNHIGACESAANAATGLVGLQRGKQQTRRSVQKQLLASVGATSQSAAPRPRKCMSERARAQLSAEISTGPESLPLASTSRSTNSITAMAALSPGRNPAFMIRV